MFQPERTQHGPKQQITLAKNVGHDGEAGENETGGLFLGQNGSCKLGAPESLGAEE